ncbi:MAG: alpha/beta fold hydrolase [Leptolyngbyaceae cyanobacterium SM1_3_5]|nr:alpha/beta fold hydrolase [Leptolyngbyaceae cyanobacterium SM1_3_5]
MKLQDQYVKVGSVNTRYWQVGDSGSVIILLHGGGGFIELWKNNVLELAKHHRVYAFDMVGAGRSDKPDTAYTFEFMAQFTQAFMQALGIPHASLIGASAGGAVATTVAMKFPKLVDRLILVGSAGLGKEVNLLLRLPTIPILGQILSSPNQAGMKMAFKQAVYDASIITEDLVNEVYEMAMLPGAMKGILNVARSNFNIGGQRSKPIVDNLKTIQAPTLIIWGRQDPMVPVAHAQKAAEIIPNAQLEIVEACGHWGPIEHPQKFNQMVLEFLQAV